MRLAILFLVACSSHATKASQEEPVTAGSGSAMRAPADAAPSNATPVIDARTVPNVDTTCQSDRDCVITDVTLEFTPPSTYACCPGCTQTAVTATSFKAFQAFCSSTQPPTCPRLGCVMVKMRAACEAGHCVARRAVRPNE